ncbi:hypothetical protein GX51_04748 [Blastomyces parvus]|uniref:YMC020W-like alpha/beta hydrolase domain-containing protein n=1 Tax=Blastomyces parvus TaxID=2060905 RepID=A0A2B7X0G4_9EURO|nr:hypothetical protein GX51_04748 [Blastomyces parvus]
MAPAGPRKRVNPNAPNAPNAPNEAGELAPASQTSPVDCDASAETRTLDNKNDKNDNRASWYTRSWPRKPKAPAVTEVARESISAEAALTPERNSSVSTPHNQNRPVRSPSIGLTKKIGGSTRSLPAEVATTRINIASISSPPAPDTSISNTNAEGDTQHSIGGGSAPVLPTVSTDAQNGQVTKELDDTVDTVPDGNQDEKTNQNTPQTQTSGWLGWIPLPRIGGESSPKPGQADQPATIVGVAKQSNKDEPLIPRADDEETEQNDTEQPATAIEQTSTAPEDPAPKKRAWLQVWGGKPASSQRAENWQNDSHAQESRTSRDNQIPAAESGDINLQTDNKALLPDGNNDLTTAPSNAAPSSSWFFWYRDTQTKPAGTSCENLERTEGSTSTTVYQDQPSASITVSEPEPGSVAADTPAEAVLPSQQPKPSTKKTTSRTKDTSPASSAAKISFPNQVLPTLKASFPVKERPSIIRQLGSLLFYCNNPEPRHVTLTNDPPRVKRALAIGVHGLFPAPLIRTVLGQPTGTSVKFSTMAAKAIHSWTESHGYSCEIQKIALEGEGRISERVDLLWKLLLNYIEDIKNADFILVACHSQGVPVATILVAKLIAFGCVSSARIGICAMAGVNLGPFPDYRSRWISGSAGELFDFANQQSKVAQDHIAALETALDFGVKIVYVGSIDDQLVSLESSIFATVSHPHIYRAVFVDGRVHAPSFLSQLVGFAMKLRNLGISDHGLIRELSSPLAGSLYSGEGHSRLYDDEALYRLAIEFTLETLLVPNAKLEINPPSRSPNGNPYILPFAMRGVLEEEYVRRELTEETTELLKLFDDWKPTSKVLKDVKFRLEGIRSKL